MSNGKEKHISDIEDNKLTKLKALIDAETSRRKKGL
jgi:hypothetical protein